jgi:hypothetical protein
MKAGHLEEVLGVEEGNDRHMLKQGEEYVWVFCKHHWGLCSLYCDCVEHSIASVQNVILLPGNQDLLSCAIGKLQVY